MAELLVEGIAATTGIDRQGHIMMPETLNDMAEYANTKGATRFTFDHDRTLPPAGKGLRAHVEKRPAGGSQLVTETIVFDAPKEITLPDGTLALIQETVQDTRPFAEPDLEVSNKIAIFTDLANFSSPQEWNEFNQEVTFLSGISIEAKAIARKSFISPPEIVFLLGGSLPLGLAVKAFIKKVVDKSSDKLSEEVASDVVSLYKVVKSAVLAGVSRFNRSDRPTTYAIQVPPAVDGLPLEAVSKKILS